MEPTLNSPPQAPPDQGNIVSGCGLALLCQIGAIVVSLFSLALDASSKVGVLLLCSWGLTQWVGIIPMIIKFKSEKKQQTIIGLSIMGAIGLLLSSACAGMFYNFRIQ